ncbi:DUF4386 domain-containing protein [Maribacter aestuarii]|uniref:DUF4386 domain-containing protein n=1 Tax=Maribacter aestuarii TaxID=1130723 RepID=UPI00248C107F|nr:DUF4386 domain-containing protein [Maribacter aestuarii]
MKTYKKNAISIGVLFIATMLVGMIDAYFVEPELKSPIINILHVERKLLTGVFSILIMAIGIVFIAIAFYPVIKKQNESIAITYLVFRVIECVLLIIGPICYLYLIALEGEAIIESGSSNFVTATILALKVKNYGFQIAMILLGIGSLFLCYALYTSRLVPRFLSIWGGIGYLLLLVSAVLDIAGLIDTADGLGAILYVPGGLWEILVFPLWLFVKGFHIPEKNNTS